MDNRHSSLIYLSAWEYVHICTHIYISLEDPIAQAELWILHPPQVIAHSVQTPHTEIWEDQHRWSSS